MLEIRSDDFVQLRGGGGEKFAGFVDDLIRGSGYIHGIADSAIRTSSIANRRDGGVDTEVTDGFPASQRNWLVEYPTIWQYKAVDTSSMGNARIEAEFEKAYVIDRIKAGYAYRLCICDEITPERKREMENAASACATKIFKSAPPAMVLGTTDLAQWVGDIPALALRLLRVATNTNFLDFDAWGRNATANTKFYVDLPERKEIRREILKHVDFSQNPPQSCFPVSGEAGVGKTRLVYESLFGIEQCRSLVMYTSDATAANVLASWLARDQKRNAILVVDEFDVASRLGLEALLAGARSRVRIVAIDNSGERSADGSPTQWLVKVEPAKVAEILEKNFTHVPLERRRIYAEEAGGFIVMAADMCMHDGEIVASGLVGVGSGMIEAYLKSRCRTDEMRKSLELLSLVTKIGMKDELEGELAELSSWVQYDANMFLENIRYWQDAGFVRRKGRYYQVAPAIVARIGFRWAWQRWGVDRERIFLTTIKPNLVDPFLKRVAQSASEEVRRLVVEFFRGWAHDLDAKDLESRETTERLVTLVGIHPGKFLPLFRNVIEQGKGTVLLNIRGDAEGGHWGPRRSIVWLCERLVGFKEYFEDAESILYRLALYESEPELGNSATRIWEQTYRIVLSGTAVPFADRLKKLEARWQSVDGSNVKLLVGAFDAIFEQSPTRMLGSPTVGNRIVPREWQPNTIGEQRQCWSDALRLLIQLTGKVSGDVRAKMRSMVVSRLRFFLISGDLQGMKEMFPAGSLSGGELATVIERLDEYLTYDVQPSPRRRTKDEAYNNDVRAWLKEIRPSGGPDRMRALVGVTPWHYKVLQSEDQWIADIKGTAESYLPDLRTIERDLVWLASDEAKSAALFGEAFGRLDSTGGCLDLISGAAVTHNATLFAAGYVVGLLEANPDQAARVNGMLDRLQVVSPQAAHAMFMPCGDITRSFGRTIDLVKTGKLTMMSLNGFRVGVRGRFLDEGEFSSLLEVLAERMDLDEAAYKLTMEVLGFRVENEKKGGVGIPRVPKILAQVWNILEHEGAGHALEQHWWGEVVQRLADVDSAKAVSVAANALISESFDRERAAAKILCNLAPQYPEMVMESFGSILLHPTEGWRLHIMNQKELISHLPLGIVRNWLDNHVPEGARQIARHLPPPQLEDGKPIVPPITEHVLGRFELDDEMFKSFCIGVHNMQMYGGSGRGAIATQHEAEAGLAKQFLAHPLRRVREWAQYEEESATQYAARDRQEDEEDALS